MGLKNRDMSSFFPIECTSTKVPGQHTMGRRRYPCPLVLLFHMVISETKTLKNTCLAWIRV
jgi:hypothetical protein